MSLLSIFFSLVEFPEFISMHTLFLKKLLLIDWLLALFRHETNTSLLFYSRLKDAQSSQPSTQDDHKSKSFHPVEGPG